MGTATGNITLYNVGALGNGTEGIYMMNDGGLGNVLIGGTNIARDNGWEGLRITTNGTVSVTNLDASYNSHRSDWTLRSIFIEAFGTGKAVTLTSINAQYNKGNGLELDVNGITTFNSVHAWLNGDWASYSGDGVYMDSHGYAINLLNYCWFMNNADSGFAYNSYGSDGPR